LQNINLEYSQEHSDLFTSMCSPYSIQEYNDGTGFYAKKHSMKEGKS